MAEENETKELEVMNISAIESMVKAESESQLDQARKYPRLMSKFKTRASEMATIDEETAASCIYRRPVGKGSDGQMKFAEGMSVRLAEIVGACYGNLKVYAILVEQTERRVVARGIAVDLETNFTSGSDVIESTVDAKGRPYSERMSTVIAKAALAKARRDATFQVVPKALARPIERAVRELLLGTTKSLDKRRAAAVGWIDSLTDNTPSGKFDPHRIWRALGIEGAADLTTEHLETLTGVRTALKDNETTLNEAFPAQTWKEAESAFVGGFTDNVAMANAKTVASFKAQLNLYLATHTASAKAAKEKLKELTGKVFMANVTEDEAKAAFEKIKAEVPGE